MNEYTTKIKDNTEKNNSINIPNKQEINRGKDPIFEGLSFKDMFLREEVYDPNEMKKGKWTEKEELKLLDYLKEYKNNYSKIASLMGDRTRSQVKDKYRNMRRVHSRIVKYSFEEDNKILFFYHYFKGNWSRMADYFDGRDYSMVKNRYYSKVRFEIGKDEAKKRYKEILVEINIERKRRGQRSILDNYKVMLDVVDADVNGTSPKPQIPETPQPPREGENNNSEDIFGQFSYNLQISNIYCKNMMTYGWNFQTLATERTKTLQPHQSLTTTSLQSSSLPKNSLSGNREGTQAEHKKRIDILKEQEIQLATILLWIKEYVNRQQKESKRNNKGTQESKPIFNGGKDRATPAAVMPMNNSN